MTGRWSVRLALFLVGLFALCAILGPVVAPYARGALDLRHPLAPPSAAHWLGTGENGVDLFSALLEGARLAAIVALAVVGTAFVTGTLVGTAAGYARGFFDAAVLRVIDVFLAFPDILLNVAIVAALRRPGVFQMILALAATAWVPYARVARAQALSLRERDFVLSARAIGAGSGRIVLSHIVPNLWGPLVVQASFGAGAVILSEASLSFLGLGPARATSWGALLDQGTGYMLLAPRLALVPGAAIAFTLLGFNVLGDALRDRLAGESTASARASEPV